MTCQLTDGSELKGSLVELEFDFRQYDPPQRDESKYLAKKCNMKYFLKVQGLFFLAPLA